MRCFRPVDSRVNAPVLVVADMPTIDAPLPIVAPIERVAAPRIPGWPDLALKLFEMALSASSFCTRGLIPLDLSVFSNESMPSTTSSFAS